MGIITWFYVFSCQKEQTIDETQGVLLYILSEKTPENVEIAVMRHAEKGIFLQPNQLGKPLNINSNADYYIEDQQGKRITFTSQTIFDNSVNYPHLTGKISIYRNATLLFQER